MGLDKKRKELELDRVELARKELQFKIEEYQSEILRLTEFIKIQITKEEDLKKQLGEME
jgi:parvulin-like peptidyl-prolyl isomerase